jgi:hypothetical protein
MYKKTKYKIGELIMSLYRNWSYYSLNELKRSKFKFDNRTLYKYWRWLLTFSNKYNKYWKSRKLVYITKKAKDKIELHKPWLVLLSILKQYDLIYKFLIT